MRPSWWKTAGLVAAAFAGGAVFSSRGAHATTEAANPYGPLSQLAKVLVLVENQYVEPASRDKLTEGAIKGMVAELDPHSAYLPPSEYSVFRGETEGKFGGVGVEVDFRNDVVTVVSPIEGSPAAKAGIKPGDQIVAIDGKPMRGERLDKLVGLMRGTPGSTVVVWVRRQGNPDTLSFSLIREIIHVTSVVPKRLVKDVAYVRLKQFQEGTHTELLQAAAKLRSESKTPLAGVILDLRNNPGGLVDEAESVADEFLSSGTIYTTRHRGKIIDEAKAHSGGAFADIPVVALVNEFSASSSELVAGALQDNHRATILGANTFGKGSVQTIFELPGGAGMRLTTMRYYTPSGRSIQAEGIRPDILIQPKEPPQLGEIVRERDLEGHLPAEGLKPAPSKQIVSAPKAAEDAPEGVTEVPTDPLTGKDFGLSLAYKTLLEAIAKKAK